MGLRIDRGEEATAESDAAGTRRVPTGSHLRNAAPDTKPPCSGNGAGRCWLSEWPSSVPTVTDWASRVGRMKTWAVVTAVGGGEGGRKARWRHRVSKSRRKSAARLEEKVRSGD
jgi:hypothetical protein